MVFSQDKRWQEDYICSGVGGEDATQHVRFRSWGTESLLIRCCRKYMPWLRYIHILLARESQLQFLDVPEDGWPKVLVHYHRDFMPEKVLPCFNSTTIEMFLHRIPGLSEQFIYSNDDFFPLSPLQETDFFRDGLPCQHHNEEPAPENPNTFERHVMSGLNMVAEDFGKKFTTTWLHGGHSMSPMLRSVVEEVCRRHEDRISHSFTLGRTDRNFNQYIYSFYQHLSGRYVDHHPRRRYVGPRVPTADLAEILRDPEAGIVCINDNRKIVDWERRAEIVRREIAEKVNYHAAKDRVDFWRKFFKNEELVRRK